MRKRNLITSLHHRVTKTDSPQQIELLFQKKMIKPKYLLQKDAKDEFKREKQTTSENPTLFAQKRDYMSKTRIQLTIPSCKRLKWA